MTQNPPLGSLKASYGSSRENTILLLIGIAACALGGLILLGVGISQSLVRDQVLLSLGGLLVLLIGLGLYAIYRCQARTSAKVYQDGFVLTDQRNRRHVCRWDDVTEVYEMPIQRDPARPGLGTVGGKYTVVRANGQRIKFGVSIENSKSLGLAIQTEVKKRILPRAIEAYKAGKTVSFGSKLSLSQQGITCGQETLPWDQVAEIKLGMGIQIRHKGRRRPWKSITHAQIANYPVLQDLLRTVPRRS